MDPISRIGIILTLSINMNNNQQSVLENKKVNKNLYLPHAMIETKLIVMEFDKEWFLTLNLSEITLNLNLLKQDLINLLCNIVHYNSPIKQLKFKIMAVDTVSREKSYNELFQSLQTQESDPMTLKQIKL